MTRTARFEGRMARCRREPSGPFRFVNERVVNVVAGEKDVFGVN